MSEFERINANVKAKITARRNEAIKRIILVFCVVLVALLAITGLDAIGFISTTFAIILAAISVCIGAFKTGYIWRDIKF